MSRGRTDDREVDSRRLPLEFGPASGTL